MTQKTFGKHRIDLSNLSKVMFPPNAITKKELVNYYDKMADFILPHVKDRPLTLHRFPDGIGSKGFFQQSRANHFPEWLQSIKIKHGGDTGEVEHLIRYEPLRRSWQTGLPRCIQTNSQPNSASTNVAVGCTWM